MTTATAPRRGWVEQIMSLPAVERAARHLADLDGFDGLDGYEALLVTPSGLARTTGGWPKV